MNTPRASASPSPPSRTRRPSRWQRRSRGPWGREQGSGGRTRRARGGAGEQGARHGRAPGEWCGVSRSVERRTPDLGRVGPSGASGHWPGACPLAGGAGVPEGAERADGSTLAGRPSAGPSASSPRHEGKHPAGRAPGFGRRSRLGGARVANPWPPRGAQTAPLTAWPAACELRGGPPWSATRGRQVRGQRSRSRRSRPARSRTAVRAISPAVSGVRGSDPGYPTRLPAEGRGSRPGLPRPLRLHLRQRRPRQNDRRAHRCRPGQGLAQQQDAPPRRRSPGRSR